MDGYSCEWMGTGVDGWIQLRMDGCAYGSMEFSYGWMDGTVMDG